MSDKASLHDRVDNDHTYHAPNDNQVSAMQDIRTMARALAHKIVEVVPGGREQSTALTKVEEAVFHANAGIARNQ